MEVVEHVLLVVATPGEVPLLTALVATPVAASAGDGVAGAAGGFGFGMVVKDHTGPGVLPAALRAVLRGAAFFAAVLRAAVLRAVVLRAAFFAVDLRAVFFAADLRVDFLAAFLPAFFAARFLPGRRQPRALQSCRPRTPAPVTPPSSFAGTCGRTTRTPCTATTPRGC